MKTNWFALLKTKKCKGVEPIWFYSYTLRLRKVPETLVSRESLYRFYRRQRLVHAPSVKSTVWPHGFARPLILNESQAKEKWKRLPRGLFDFLSMSRRTRGTEQTQCLQGWKQQLNIFFLFCFLFLWSSHQLPLQWLPSRPRISQDTPFPWPGSHRKKPTGSFWSMRSSTTRRWGTVREILFLLNRQSKSSLWISCIVFFLFFSCPAVGPEWKKLPHHKILIKEHRHQGPHPPHLLCFPCAGSHSGRLRRIQRPVWVHDQLGWVKSHCLFIFVFFSLQSQERPDSSSATAVSEKFLQW